MRFSATARRGFTLVELLVVLAILSILAGLLFPVFAAAKRSALATSCLMNFRHATQGTLLYTGDYDDRLMPLNHRPGSMPGALEDRVWPQILLPYLGGAFRTFDCPAEPEAMEFGGTFDPDLMPGDYVARYDQAALHSDLGYNAYYLAPIVRQGDGWIALPKATTEIETPSKTLLFVESRSGTTGSYLVAPPCRYVAVGGGYADTFISNDPRTVVSEERFFAPIEGWSLSSTLNSFPTGGVGARHNGRANTSRLDGSAKSASIRSLVQGCDLRTAWRGTITDPAQYLWSGTR